MPATKFVRKPNRLPFKRIYKTNNSFFVTVCVEERSEIFAINLNGKIVSNINNNNGDTVVLENGDTVVLENGDTVVASTTGITKLCEKSLLNLYQIYENIDLGDWVIMPNHIHFIIHFTDTPKSKITKKDVNLGSVIKSFKLYFQKSIVEATTVSPLSQEYFVQKKFNHQKFWQKSFYDHVIRGEKDLQRIREYIYNNPLQWELDILNPKNEDKYQKWLITKNGKLLLS